MYEKSIKITKEYGIHVRPSGLLVKIAQKSPNEVYISTDGINFGNAKSIMSILELHILKDDILIIKSYDVITINKIIKLIKSNFNLKKNKGEE